MKAWHFYRLSDGTFTGQSMRTTSETVLRMNVPEGCAAISGVADPESQRVDVESGQVVDWQPPRPDADHRWDADLRRWVKAPEILEWENARHDALARLTQLDLKRSRALSDHALRPDERAGVDRLLPVERLEQMEVAAEELRSVVNRPKPVPGDSA